MSISVKLPFCADCGTGSPHVVSVSAGEGKWAHVWLCASCEYKRARLDANPRVLMPNERRVPKQRETLW